MFPMFRLPEDIRRTLDASGRTVEPYAELSKYWHNHAVAFAPDYGAYARALIDEKRIRSGAALDLACGTGITTLSLAQIFPFVVALDASEPMLAEARRRLAPCPNVEILHGDFRAFSFNRCFDLVTCSGDSLNYAQDPGELTAVFRCVARVLEQGGVFVFDVQAPASAGSYAVRIRRDGYSWYQVFAYDGATGVDVSRAVTDAGVELHRRRLFTPAEIDAAASGAGLVHADRLDRGFLRALSRSGGRDFYSFTLAP
jgi:SAM-dependent methyltransferase